MSWLALGLICASTLLITSCKKGNDNYAARFYKSGEAKPAVAVVPVIDNSQSSLTWDLSDELTTTIARRMGNDGKLYLVDRERVKNITKNLSESQNPFSAHMDWIKTSFEGNDFVVFMELIEHQEVFLNPKANSSNTDCSAELHMSVRVRVVDLRGEKPQITLQEMVFDNHLIPRPFTSVNFYQVPWGHESFVISPVGLAHAQLTKEIATRVEDYILLTK